jgi:hypothetical protein
MVNIYRRKIEIIRQKNAMMEKHTYIFLLTKYLLSEKLPV